MIKKLFPSFVFFVIFVCGAILRFSGAFKGEFAFTFDVGRDMLVVAEMIDKSRPVLLGPTAGVQGIFYGPWWYYFLSLPLMLSQGNPQFAAFFMGLLSLIGALILFLLAKKMRSGNNFWPLVVFALVSFSPYVINSTVQIWNPNLTFFYLSLWLVFLFLSDKKQKFFLSAGLGATTALVLESQIAFGLFFLISQLSILFFVFKSKRKISFFGSFFAGLFIIFLPRLLFEFRHEFLQTKNLFNFISGGRGPTESLSLLVRFQQRGAAFLGIWSDTLAYDNQVIGIGLLGITLFGLIVFRKNLSQFQAKLADFCLLLIVSLFTLFVFYPGDFYWYYLVGLPFFYCLILGLGLSTFSNQKILPKKVFYLFIFAYLAFLLYPPRIGQSLTASSWTGNVAVYRNAKTATERVLADANGQPFNAIIYTPSLIPHPYHYLFDYLGKTKFDNFPQKENQRLLYVLIEPDPGLEERQEEWLNLHQQDGKIVEEIELPSGLLYQKRIRNMEQEEK